MAGTLSPSLSRSARLPTSDQSTQNSIGNAFRTAKRWVKNRAPFSGNGALSTIPTNNTSTSTLTQLSPQTNHRQCAVLPSKIWLHTLNKYGSFEELFNLSKVSKDHRANVIGLIKQRFHSSSDEELEQLYKLLLSKEAQTAYQNNPDFKMLLDNGPAQWAKKGNFAEIFKLLLLRNNDQTNENKSLTREELIRLKLPTLEAPANTASTLAQTAANPSIPFSKDHSEYFLKLLPLLLTQKQEPNFEVFFTKVLPEWINGITPERVIVNQLQKNPSNSDIECLYTCNMFIDDRIYVNRCKSHPMVFSAMWKHLGVLKALIDRGFNINAPYKGGSTALHYFAGYLGNTEAIKLLINKGADVNKTDDNGITPLHFAASWRDIEAINLLIQGGANLGQLDNEGCSPLYYAADMNRVDIATLLIDKGADVNQTDKNGRTQLHAAATSASIKNINLLIQLNANVNLLDNKGFSPLYYAVKRNHLAIATLLIDKGADINQTASDGKTALHNAAASGNIDNINLLIQLNANVNLLDNEGFPPLYYAVKRNHLDIATLLIDKGADINQTDKNGKTLLHAAATSGSIKNIKLLIHLNANINLLDNERFSALHYAAKQGHAEIVECLIAHPSLDRNRFRTRP